jgi:Transposase DDE domain group 1
VIVELDATVVTARRRNTPPRPGRRPSGTAFADHGADGNGEPLAIVLRAGNAGSNTAADHIQAAALAVAQLPRSLRGRVLIRADSGGGTRDFLRWLTTRPRPLRYSIGMTITDDMQDAILKVPPGSWTPPYDDDGQVRDGA